jgi:hypothetical protein
MQRPKQSEEDEDSGFGQNDGTLGAQQGLYRGDSGEGGQEA